MTTLLRSSTMVALTSALALAACRGKDNAQPAAAGGAKAAPVAGGDSAQTSTRGETGGTMAGMPGMSGTMSGMMSTAMADSMQAHMREVGGMSADRMKAMAPMHRQMVANMLSQMNAEMRQMNMAADPAWTAVVDSVRQDQIHIPDMSGSELKTFMPEHSARVTRLIQMHQRMMGGMKK